MVNNPWFYDIEHQNPIVYYTFPIFSPLNGHLEVGHDI